MGEINRYRYLKFKKQVLRVRNTGHLLIEEGLSSLNLNLTADTISIWDTNIGTAKCSCKRLRMKPEILIGTSVISHEAAIFEASDFHGFDDVFEHLIKHHRIRAVLGLGINGMKDDRVLFEKLSNAQKNFIRYLKLNNVAIGCRGNETKDFFINLGFESENLFLTGCPSLQLIKPFSLRVKHELSRIVVTGALRDRLDLVEELEKPSIEKILFLPQTLDSYMYGLELSKTDQRIEIFLPSSYESWMNKLKKWNPDLTIGTRLHGNLSALSLGIPTLFMGGDIRTREVTQLANLPFADDLRDTSSVRNILTGHYLSNQIGVSDELGSQLRACIRQFID